VKLAIMQPYLFPYLGYFQLLHAVDRFVVYDDVSFIKQGWINRNRILINGAPCFITVPVKHASSFAMIRETMMDERQHERWVEKLLKSVSNAYRRAPEFARVFPVVESVFGSGARQVGDLARASLKAVASMLEITTTFVETSSSYGKSDLKGEDRVLAICEAERATEYINLPGGRTLYSPDRFAAHGIELSFLMPRPVEYRQFGDRFVPWLSIIDVLMFNPLDRVREYLAAYDLT
jgi:hypothetical protein